ncbi:unannotated protein [freshwater metagenome]|uniref:Unannotated protein n=1 Tax=freshwater metagenome TaxID=449393 RepID=A0A6J7F3H0_9ZZZZ|nr:twin-arginine translocase subunit TatC [Actinomycetota bacterium]
MNAPLGGKMPLVEHFRELRKRVVKSAIGVLLFSVIAWFFYDEIIAQLASPFCDLRSVQSAGDSNCGTLYINGVLGPLNLQIKVALMSGFIFSAPVWIYQLWAFVAPGLHKRERRRSIFFFLAAVPFFAIGSVMGYLILPVAVRVLLGFTPGSLTNLVRFDDYLDFVLRIILLFGGAFELPVFLLALNIVGVLSARSILKPWRIAIFLIVLFTAMFTPTADPLTMSLLALPLIFFYFAAGIIALGIDRKRSKRAASNG